MAYSVSFWGSDPDEDNDDCWTGQDFGTLAEAEAAFAATPRDRSVAWVMIDGPDVHRTRPVPGYRPQPDDYDAERREHAMQAGMAGGCEAYNEAMGWEVGE